MNKRVVVITLRHVVNIRCMAVALITKVAII